MQVSLKERDISTVEKQENVLSVDYPDISWIVKAEEQKRKKKQTDHTRIRTWNPPLRRRVP